MLPIHEVLLGGICCGHCGLVVTQRLLAQLKEGNSCGWRDDAYSCQARVPC